MRRGIDLGREKRQLEGDIKTVRGAIERIERRGKQSDPLVEVRRQAELKAERDLLSRRESDLKTKNKEIETNDRKVKDAVRDRDRLSREQDNANNEMRRVIDSMRSAASQKQYTQVRGKANQVLRMVTDMERRAGKIKALE